MNDGQMEKGRYSQRYLDWVRQRKMSKRAREALEIMIANGSVTTEELSSTYGLQHPPRAMSDLKDAGVVFESRLIQSATPGKRVAQYSLVDVFAGDGDEGGSAVFRPRKAIPKKVKQDLIMEHGPRCTACGGVFRPTQLQVDHRIPFRIGGDPEVWDDDTVMLLCNSDNRAKSWTCEHCPNWDTRNADFCRTCYWCIPDGPNTHVADDELRRTEIVWSGEEIVLYDEMAKQASVLEMTVQEYIKYILEERQ